MSRYSSKNGPVWPSATYHSREGASEPAVAVPPFQNVPSALKYIVRSAVIGTSLVMTVENERSVSSGTALA